MADSRSPFRADHVGSLLRPPALKALRLERESGKVSEAELRAAEDAAIRDGVKLQEDVGLQGITDGEMRRKSWHMDFLLQLSGLSSEGKMLPVTFHGREGDRFFTRPDLRIASRVTRPKPIFVEAFKFLRSATTRTPKLTIPSPCMLYTQVGRANIDPAVYPDLDAFVDDLAAAYRAEIADLYAAGCRYLQLDDVSLAYLCDDEMRARGRAQGDDPDAQLALSVKLIRATLRDRPKDLTVCTHLCRGNFRSAWRAKGGYAGIAETIFNQMPYDGFFLEFDDARSGDFSPLRHVPKHVRVVLGLVTSKTAALEKKDDLKRRLDEASKYIAPEQLCVSPQCGFSSTVEGNDVRVEDERAKLSLCVDVAREVGKRVTVPRDHSKTVGGLTFHYVAWGPESAPPLVLLHGLTSHARSWDALGRELSENRRVIALDQRGHGDSDRAPDGDYRVATMAGDVAGFVDALGLERFELLGLSMGGRIGIAYAGGHVARIERLCVVDIGPEIHLPGMERIRGMMAASPERIGSEEDAIELMRRANPRAPEAGLRERVRHAVRPLPDGGLEWKYDKALRDMMRQGGRRDTIDLWEPLRRITAPTLLVRGADSDVLSPEIAKRMIEALPDGRLVEIPGAGHPVPLDQPEAFARAVRAFLGA